MQDTLSISPKLFTQATTTAVVALRLQNQSPHSSLFMQVTLDDTPPDDLRGAVLLWQGTTLTPDLPLHRLFPGVLANGGAGYVWLWADDGATVSVSHA
ncbi:MAG: hypothetical protein Q7J24_01960 [Desulfomicrobium sp.]|nr:hypothetical protein [Desulfomicrobium sp.]